MSGVYFEFSYFEEIIERKGILEVKMLKILFLHLYKEL